MLAVEVEGSFDRSEEKRLKSKVEKTTREGNKMKQDGRFPFLYSPVFRVITTWVWFLVGAALVLLIVLAVYGFDLAVLGEKQYLTVYIEIVSAGLLPVLFTLICKDYPTQYGLGRKGLAKSLLLSGLCIAAFCVIAFLSPGQLMSVESPDFHLDFPWNLWYAALGVFAWGPLEVFFVMWLVTNTDRIFNSENRTMSWGLIVTVVIFGMIHMLTTRRIYTAFYVGTIFFVLGLIYKYTKNSFGPMIAWTLINGQIRFIVQILWS